jgi:acetyl-CoA carboxylase biotin carboxyl carrier protein
MDFREIQELLRLINKLELSEFKMKQGDFEINIRTKNFAKGKDSGSTYIPYPEPTLPALEVRPATEVRRSETAAATPEKSKSSDESSYIPIKSPMVGTFYRSSSPDKPAYAKVGDLIDKGTVVCMIEAMKLFNEIESDISGTVVKVLVEDAQPVEYDQVLFLIDPKG